MSPSSPSLRIHASLRLAAGLLAGVATGRLAGEPVAVFSEVFNGYQRTLLPDKTFEPETYVFGEGGAWTRAVKDPVMEQMTFLKVAHTVAGPLARLNYRPGLKPAETDLLILVYWGATLGSQHSDPADAKGQLTAAISAYVADKPLAEEQAKAAGDPDSKNAEPASAFAYDTAMWLMALQNRDRDRMDDFNARILGYTDSLGMARVAPQTSFAQDTFSEVADNRYFVVLQAYHFPTARKEKKLKPLWTIRMSMSESGKRFDRTLDSMLASAARYFGQPSKGLRRTTTPEGRVELGPIKVIETVPEK